MRPVCDNRRRAHRPRQRGHVGSAGGTRRCGPAEPRASAGGEI